MTAMPHRPATRVESHTLIGTPAEITRVLATNRRNGRLVTATRPVPAPSGDGRVIVHLRLQAVTRPSLTGSRTARTRAAVVPSHRTRRIVLITAGVCAVVAVVGTVVVLVLDLVHAVVHALAGSTDLIVGVVVVVLVVSSLFAAGGVHHCPGCRH